MSARVALCVDAVTCRNPEIIGLGGEALDSLTWLDVFSEGADARSRIAQDEGIGEAWVVSVDDVEPINLAATLKADRPSLNVKLVTAERCGSLFSRAHTALIDEVIDHKTFIREYVECKSRWELESEVVGCAGDAGCSDDAEGGEPPALAPVLDEAETASMALTQPVAVLSAQKTARAFLLPVVSGSGGAGKSSVAVMGAHIARAMGFQTLLLDYDLQFGDVDVMAGVENALAIDEAIARPDKLEHEMRRDPGLAVVAAPVRLEAAEDVVRAMPGFLDEVSGAFDVIIANTGAAWAEQHAVLLERSSAALFLIDQRASSVRACRHALELCARCGIASGPFQFAVNRCAKNAPLTSVDVSCALQGAPVFELKDGGRDVEDYLGGGGAADLLDSRNDFCASLEHVMTQILPGAPQLAGGKSEPADGVRPSKRRGRHATRKRGWGA